MKQTRFDPASLIDAAGLAWGLLGLGLFHLGARMIRAGDDALDVWTDHDEGESGCERHYYAIDGTCQRCGADSVAEVQS